MNEQVKDSADEKARCAEPETSALSGHEVKKCSNGTDKGVTVNVSFHGGISQNDPVMIRELIYSFGNYFWEEEGRRDFSFFSARLQFENHGETNEEREYTVHLPDCFSFEPDRIITEKRGQVSILAHTGEEEEIRIYTLFHERADERFELRLEGGVQATAYLPVRINPEEGKVKMRPTPKVNHGAVDTEGNEIPMQELVPLTMVGELADADLTVYNDQLALLCCTLSQAAYNQNGYENDSDDYIRESLFNLGFHRFEWFPNSSSHNVALGLAQKTVVLNGEISVILLIAVRGTVDREWIGNFNVLGWDRTVHADFSTCARRALKKIRSYAKKYQLDRTKTTVLICGHSRGAAVAGLIAHAISEKKELANRLAAYTFAAPNYTVEPVKVPGLFNLVYRYDLVPYLPHLDYGKHGTTFVVGGENPGNAPEAVREAFETRTHGNKYKKVGNLLLIQIVVAMDEVRFGYPMATLLQYWIGSGISGLEITRDNELARAHCGENYLAWTKNNGIRDAISMEEAERDMMNREDGEEAQKFMEELHDALESSPGERFCEDPDFLLMPPLYWIRQAYKAGQQSLRLYHFLQSYAQTDMAGDLPGWMKYLLRAE